MRLAFKALVALVVLLFLGCATRPNLHSALEFKAEPFEDFLLRQERLSWQLLQRNISPTQPKTVRAPTPRAGVVVAALAKKDPDYYFHWVRDSATVMNSVINMARAQRPLVNQQDVEQKISAFVDLSRHLQNLKAPYGLGEPRYTVEGEVDRSPWSRPQFDGPALRALVLLNDLSEFEARPRARALEVLKTDLDFIARVYPERGFDIWEEYRAENYHTRLVQLAALEKGAAFFARPKMDPARARLYARAAQELEKVLDDHWDPARGFLRSQLAIVATDGFTGKKTDLDSAVLVAVIEAHRDQGAHSVLDDRVHATVAVLEDLFRRSYPINANPARGLAYGRYKDDIYYGGNPWFLITAHYAQFYYRLAIALKKGAAFPVTQRNLAFLNSVMSEASPLHWAPDTVIHKTDPRHAALIAKFAARGDSILKRLQQHIPADGEIYEQLDKNSGLPLAAKGLGWGHASFLEAHLERLKLRELR